MRYFRQALALIREEKLYSAMYIAGTALAVAFVMLIAEVYYVKVADIAPEVHRSTTYYLPNLEIKNSDGSEMKGINQWMFRDDLYFRVMRAVKDGIDGLIVGSPVYYGGPNGSLCA